MAILDGMLPPPKPRNKNLDRLIEMTRQRMEMLEIEHLSRMAAHEYDDAGVVPPPGSPGEVFLYAVAGAFGRWLGQEGRFPLDHEVDGVDGVADEVRWHREATGAVVAQAFVDLGLFYSHHADVARGATVADFQRVLDSVANQLIFTLTEEYAPLV